jgi:hypothetical protein
MFGNDLVDLASIVDLQCFRNFTEVVDGEEKIQILGFIQRTMEVNV